MTQPRRAADDEPRTLYEGRRARKDVAKYLLPGEDVIIATRRHWASLAEPVAKSLPLLVIGFWLLLLDRSNHLSSAVGLILLGPPLWNRLRELIGC